MALPTIYWFSKIGEYTAKVVPFVATILAFFAWSYNIVAVMIVSPLQLAKAQLQIVSTAYVTAADWGVFTFIGFVNAIFPLSEGLALLSFYWTFCICIIVARWIKSFIPTISN